MSAPQQIWHELRNVALLGAGGRRLPMLETATETDASAPLTQLLADMMQQETPEQAVLMGAGVLAWAQTLGRRCEQDLLPLPEASLPAQARACSGEVELALRQILQTDLSVCLPLWLKQAARLKLAVDALLLPRLLELGRQNVSLRGAILAVLDQPGLWLAQKNPAWQWVMAMYAAGAAGADVQVDDAWWQQGSMEQRMAWLRAARLRDAAAALAALQAVLAEEKAANRASLIAVLAVNLQPDDEVFLESQLDDRSKLVRQAAAQLLARLPASAWRRRMRARVQVCLSWQKGEQKGEKNSQKNAADNSWLARMAQGMKTLLVGSEQTSLQVDLPAACDAAMQRDGIDDKPPAGSGERAFWLGQMLALLPLQDWIGEGENEAGGAELVSTLDALAASEWSKLFMRAAEQSCSLHQDADLAYALLQREQIALPLFRLISPPQQRELLASLLRQSSPQELRQKLPAYHELFSAPGWAWDAELTTQFLQALLSAIFACANEHESHSLRHWLLQLAVQFDLDSLANWWQALSETERARLAGYGTQYLPEKMTHLISFLLQMRAAFAALQEPDFVPDFVSDSVPDFFPDNAA